jgi:aryl carrier-like protein
MDRAVSTVKRLVRLLHTWRRQGGKIGSRRPYLDESELSRSALFTVRHAWRRQGGKISYQRP